MPRPAKWNSPSEAVRLPKHAIDACLKLAAALDAPPPQTASDPAIAAQFQGYQRFVQNCQPTMVSIADGLDERQYLIAPQPVSFEEYQQLERAIASLESRMEAEKFNEHDRMYLFSKLVEEVCKPMKGGDRSS